MTNQLWMQTEYDNQFAQLIWLQAITPLSIMHLTQRQSTDTITNSHNKVRFLTVPVPEMNH